MVWTQAPSLEEAERGIYIDFEGRPTHHPALLGCAYSSGDLTESVVGQALVGDWSDATRVRTAIASLPPEGRLPSQDLHQVLDALLTLAEHEDRRVLSYSQHELRMIRLYAPDLYDRTLDLYRDPKKGLKRWWYQRFSEDPPEDKHRLQMYLSLLGCQDYASGEPKFVGGVISAFESFVESDTSSLPDDFGDQWMAALRKNRDDCEGVRCAIIKGLSDLE